MMLNEPDTRLKVLLKLARYQALGTQRQRLVVLLDKALMELATSDDDIEPSKNRNA